MLIKTLNYNYENEIKLNYNGKEITIMIEPYKHQGILENRLKFQCDKDVKISFKEKVKLIGNER